MSRSAWSPFGRSNRYGSLGELVTEAPAELDVVVPSARERLAPLLRGARARISRSVSASPGS